ncbi:MAG: hypothetical protein ACRDOD_25270 [Streptosporangiaceae bacterium]
MAEVQDCAQCGTPFTPRREHAASAQPGRTARNQHAGVAAASAAAIDWPVTDTTEAGRSRHGPGQVREITPEAKAAFFGALLAARTDVYAIRYDNSRAAQEAPREDYGLPASSPLPCSAVLASHLKGEAHLGLYPLLDGDGAGARRRTPGGLMRCSTR